MNTFAFIVFLVIIFIQKRLYKFKNAQVASSLEKRAIYPSSKVTQLFGQARGLLFLVGFWGVAWECFSPNARAIPIENFIPGLIVSLLGLGLLKWSLHSLGMNYAPCNLVRKPDVKVTHGPYRYFRHPIYLSNLLILGGILCSYPNILGLISWLSLAVFYIFSARDENRVLAWIPEDREKREL